MIVFAELLELLTLTPGRLAKIALLRRFFASEPDPDRGWGLAALTGELGFELAKPAVIRLVAERRLDPVLLGWSRDFVGDMAETVSLMWPATAGGHASPSVATPPSLTQVVETLSTTTRASLPDVVEAWLDASETDVRYAILKLITGSLRVGVSARLAKTALAELAGGRLQPDDIEEVWHGLAPPYAELFAWVEGRAERPDPGELPIFRPPMLAQPLEPPDMAGLDPATLRAEWKWDGIRVQLVAARGGQRIFSRGSEEIGAAFPEILEAMDFHAVLDGELLVMRAGEHGELAIAPFADLQQRLNRKQPGGRMLATHPAYVRLYDILFDGDEDVRALPFDARRERLERWFAAHRPARMDLSPLIPFETLDELAELRAGAREASIEGLMLKRRDAPYVPGRPKGLWWKWKRAPLTIDAVMMYAQRGSGRRSSYYSDYTFGLWRECPGGEPELVPVGKAYSGYTDEELLKLDRWIRNNTTARFGPVREVAPGYVLEVAFDGVQRSDRHKSGVALRFPRIARLRPDKPAADADRLDVLISQLPK